MQIDKYKPVQDDTPGARLAHIAKGKWFSVTCIGYTERGFTLVDAKNKRNLDVADYMIFKEHGTNSPLI
jgi:hypothetical protein